MSRPAIRLDKWLWHARVVKSRTLAQKLVTGGKIRINRVKVHAPGRTVSPGDTLTITLPTRVLVYEIATIGERRGPFSEARLLYIDRSPPPSNDRREPGPDAPRPDARQRRARAALRGKIV